MGSPIPPDPEPFPLYSFMVQSLWNWPSPGKSYVTWYQGGLRLSTIVNNYFDYPSIAPIFWTDVINAGTPNAFRLSFDQWGLSSLPGADPQAIPGDVTPTLTLPQQDYLSKLTNSTAYISSHPNPGGQNAISNNIPTGPPGPKKYYRIEIACPDSDGDGLYDYEEFDAGTNPFQADSDGDGFSDFVEVRGGSKAMDPRDFPFDSAHPPAYADLWVDANHSGSSTGTREEPYNGNFPLNSAYNNAAPNALIAVRAGSYVWDFTSNTSISKPVRFVAVDGPGTVHLKFYDDGGGLISVRFVVYNPAYESEVGLPTDDTWNPNFPVGGPDVIPPANPMTLEFHEFHFTDGVKAPLFYLRPKCRLVLANCYLNSLLCGVAQCDSSEIYLLNSQIVENGDTSRVNYGPTQRLTMAPPGVVRLRGNARAQIWHCTFADNVKDAFDVPTGPGESYTVSYGTVTLEGKSQAVIRNSIFWETNWAQSDQSAYLGGRQWDITDPPTDPLDKHEKPEFRPATSAFRATSIKVASTATADVQSCMVWDSNNTSVYPSPPGGAGNLPTSSNPLFTFYNSTTADLDPMVHDLRTRRLGYSSAVPSTLADGVTSTAMDTSTGLLGPAGYRHHLRYDLEGHARQRVYRKTGAATGVTKVDIGAVESIPTIRDNTVPSQASWTSLAKVTSNAAGAVRLAASLRSPTANVSAGRVLSVDANTGRATADASIPLSLDGLQGDNTVRALCFNTSTNKLYGFGDQRRGGLAVPANIYADQWPTAHSHMRGCTDKASEKLAACLQCDNREAPLRGCVATLTTAATTPGFALLQNADSSIDTFRTSTLASAPGNSPYRQQATTGLRAAIRTQLSLLANQTGSGTGINSLKATNAYPDGVLIAWNTINRFGSPKDGRTYNVGTALPYDGGVEGTEGTVIVSQVGSSATEQTYEFTPPANPYSLFFRAWPYVGNDTSRVYGPSFDANVENGSHAVGTDIYPPDNQRSPLVINEVMSGTSGWVEVFNTWGEAIPAGSATLASMKLMALTDSGSTIGGYTVVADLSGVTFPARGFKVFSIYGVTALGNANINTITKKVISVTITRQGQNYATPPTVTFSGGGGTGAAGTAVLTSGKVTTVTITNGGANYTSAPTVTFAAAPAPPDGSVAFVANPEVSIVPLITITSTSRVLITKDGNLFDSTQFDRLRGKPRNDGIISQGRAWDNGPRGAQPIDDSLPDDSALFAGDTSTLPEHPITKGTSNTANYTDATVGTVAQPYFQVSEKSDTSKIWLSWRNLGNTGCTWEADGLRHDYAGCRVNGAALNGADIYTGLRMPLSNRKTGNALLVKVPVANVTNAGGNAWGSPAGTVTQLDLGNRGIRAIQWCPDVEGGKYLIIAGPPTTADEPDHPMTGRFALYSWAGGTAAAVLRIADLAPYARFPTGLCSFLLPGSTEARICFAQALPENDVHSLDQEHLIHWPVTIINP